MSHFCIIVTDTLEEDHESQLAPFSEQDEEYFEQEIEIPADKVKDTVIELLRETQQRIDSYESKPELNEHEKSSLDYYKKSLADYQKWNDEGNYDEIISQYYGYEKNEDGDYYSQYNPDAKWDWYEIGGRWTGFFKLKDDAPMPVLGGHYSQKEGDREKLAKEKRSDIAKVKDIDWEGMRQEGRESAGKEFDRYQSEDNKPMWGNPPKEGETRDEYIARNASLAPFGVLDQGEWYERGSMGWWGVVSDENDDWDKEFDAILKQWLKEKPDMELTIVDCHI